MNRNGCIIYLFGCWNAAAQVTIIEFRRWMFCNNVSPEITHLISGRKPKMYGRDIQLPLHTAVKHPFIYIYRVHIMDVEKCNALPYNVVVRQHRHRNRVPPKGNVPQTLAPPRFASNAIWIFDSFDFLKYLCVLTSETQLNAVIPAHV